MKLSEELRQNHECGDFGRALEGLPEKAERLEKELEHMSKQYFLAMCEAHQIIQYIPTVEVHGKCREAEAWMKKYFPRPYDSLTEEQLKEVEQGYRRQDDPDEPYPCWGE